MIKYSIFILFVFSTIISVEAKKSIVNNTRRELIVNIQMGEKLSNITIKSNNDYSVTIQNSEQKGSLSQKNFDFISKKTNYVFSEQSSNLENCSRSYIEVLRTLNGKKDKRIFCVGPNIRVPKNVSELINILAML